MDGKYVFISYKAEEYDQALWVKQSLEEGGISCWMAPMSIRGGLSYAQEIPPAIRNSGVFVLLLSQKAQESKWVPRELDQAINDNKVIMPFVLEDCPLRSDFSFYLTNVQRYDAFRDMEGTMLRMVQDIQKILGIVPPPPKAEKPEPVEQPPVEPEEVPAPSKPKKEKKPARKKTAGKKSAGKKRLPLILGVAALVLVVLIFLCQPRSLTIGGVTFEEDDYSVRIEDATLTAADLAKFSRFEDLSAIHLVRCKIQPRNLSPMISDGLMVLDLTDCNISDAQFASIDFTMMRRFSELYVSGNPDLTDISSVTACAEDLTSLDISDTGIKDFAWLKSLTKLEDFYADRIGLWDTSVLEPMIYLERLSLSGNGITSLEGLKNTSKLAEVDLSNNALTDVSVLSRSAACLTVLHLEDNGLTDLSCLSGADGLRKVYVDGNGLQALTWLNGNKELEVLSASRNRIESIAGLGVCQQLRLLNLSDNLLQTIEAGDIWFGQYNFLLVNLSNNRLTTVNLPLGCTYQQLVLLGNPQVELAGLRSINGWDLYFDFPQGISLQTLQELSFYSLCIVGCPLDRQVEIEEGLNNEELMTLEEALEEIALKIEEADY